MKNLARNLLGNPLDAEDAVQETFLKIQRSISGFRGQSSFVTWTFRILVNTCHDARRKRTRNQRQVRPGPRIDHAQSFCARRVRRAIAAGNVAVDVFLDRVALRRVALIIGHVVPAVKAPRGGRRRERLLPLDLCRTITKPASPEA